LLLCGVAAYSSAKSRTGVRSSLLLMRALLRSKIPAPNASWLRTKKQQSCFLSFYEDASLTLEIWADWIFSVAWCANST